MYLFFGLFLSFRNITVDPDFLGGYEAAEKVFRIGQKHARMSRETLKNDLDFANLM